MTLDGKRSSRDGTPDDLTACGKDSRTGGLGYIEGKGRPTRRCTTCFPGAKVEDAARELRELTGRAGSRDSQEEVGAVPRRRYDKRTKLAAVMAAEMGGVVQAEEQTGIPESTIRYWMDKPEFAEVRAKTREDLADEIKVVAHLAWRRIAEALRTGEMEPRDATFAAEKATSLQILMSGGATARMESRDITGTLADSDIIAAILECRSISIGQAVAELRRRIRTRQRAKGYDLYPSDPARVHHATSSESDLGASRPG